MLINHKLDFNQLINYACAPCAAKAKAAEAERALQGWIKPQWSPFMSFPFLITPPAELTTALSLSSTIAIASANQFVQIAIIEWMRSDPNYSRLLS